MGTSRRRPGPEQIPPFGTRGPLSLRARAADRMREGKREERDRERVQASHITLSRQALPLPRALGEAGSYPVLHERTPRTGSELVPSLGASLGPNPASPLIRRGAQARA
ncbi:unnamed protein product [Pleuronectes platessa]|uniref:Uncharacterized protein n=1 Tax=Pleuronectes platessa TaxID=8262 RepID=A0A9N7YM64_PLEPL|nr:unnamed protein product [Pleuronectes platessa]